MLTKPGGGPNDRAWSARERNRLPHHLNRFPFLRLYALHNTEMLDLRVGKHRIDRIDRPARHAGRVQAIDPCLARAAGETAVDLGVERIAVFQARTGSGVSGPSHQRSRSEGAA